MAQIDSAPASVSGDDADMPPNERPAAQLPRILAGEGKPYDKVMSYVLLIPVDQDLDQRTLMRESSPMS